MTSVAARIGRQSVNIIKAARPAKNSMCMSICQGCPRITNSIRAGRIGMATPKLVRVTASLRPWKAMATGNSTTAAAQASTIQRSAGDQIAAAMATRPAATDRPMADIRTPMARR